MDSMAGAYAANICMTKLNGLGGTSLFKKLLNGVTATDGVTYDLRNHTA